MSTYIKPTHYTTTDGGVWKLWEGKKIDVTELPKYTSFTVGRSKFILLPYKSGQNIKIHSLAFDDPAFGLGNFPRWDSINGWTTDLNK